MKANHSFMKEVMEDLARDEGFRQHPYLCSAGALTIGYGRNLDAKGVSRAEADILLRNDVVDAQADLERVFPVASSLSDARYRALVNMMFNLGAERFMGFRRMRAAIERGDFEAAADEMLDSRWARQVGARAERLADLMRRG
jgi:lysozyme